MVHDTYIATCVHDQSVIFCSGEHYELATMLCCKSVLASILIYVHKDDGLYVIMVITLHLIDWKMANGQLCMVNWEAPSPRLCLLVPPSL